ncbi:hypothetical protein ACP3V9_25415, partial [Salmonella enterica]|uniref:hypothetical protein n=1 Tax=Salmonella enterica TaxID=28901 RepID=UPI003CF4DA38
MISVSVVSEHLRGWLSDFHFFRQSTESQGKAQGRIRHIGILEYCGWQSIRGSAAMCLKNENMLASFCT